MPSHTHTPRHTPPAPAAPSPGPPSTHQGECKERFNAIQQELAQLNTKFTNNVQDATKVCVCVCVCVCVVLMHVCICVCVGGGG